MLRKLLTVLLLFTLVLSMFNNLSYPIGDVDSPMSTDKTAINALERGTYDTANAYPEPMDISGNTYSDHAPITITSNSEFLSQKTTESWNGTGVEGDPIEITGYNFTSTSGNLISISNTDLHFTILGNFFRVPTENHNGIYLSNVTNGNITDNYFDKADFGIYLDDANFTTITGNHFTSFAGAYVTSGRNNSISRNYFNTTDTSVMLYSSSTYNNTIYNNTLLGSTYGIYLYGALENVVTLNNITQTSLCGIYLVQTTAAYNVISDNIIHDLVGSGITGIFVSSYAHNNTINLNNISNVTLSVRLSYSDNNTISKNQITNTTQAISVESSQWNEVYLNNISDVSDGFDGAFSLYVYKGGNNTLHHNNISDTDNAVFIYQSGQNDFHQNNIYEVRAFGFNMMTGVLNTISDNEISNGTTAFYLQSSSTSNMFSRNILQFQNQGIQLQTTSHYNSFYENTILNATNYGITSTTSSYLTIYNNTITNSGLRGVNIGPSSYHVIAFNELTNNGQYGIYLDTGLGSQIYNNTVRYHTTTGAYLISTNQHNVSYNTFANSTIGLALVLSSPGYTIGNIFANNSDTGLLLSASNGIPVSDNLFYHNGVYGIRLSNSYGTPIENNTIHSGIQHGIAIETGSDLTFIKNNDILHNGMYGIWVRFGPNTIRLNNISGNGVGVYIDTATSNSIESNFIDSNTDGVRLVDSDDNTILLNMIYNNSQYGIYSESGFPQESTGNHIYNNTVISNGGYGVWLYATARTTEVKWNDFINNTVNAADSNPSSYLNVWDENFYDDWDHVLSYYVIGVTTNDYNPADLPLNPSRVHFMLAPSITSPVTGSDYTGDLTILWNAAYDSDEHAVSYALLYSNDSGSTWNPIVSGLTNTSFYWNATSLAEGTEYQVRLIASDTTNTTLTSDTGAFSIDTQAPRLGVVPSNFTVELSWDPIPVLNFSAYDSNPDWAHVQWLGYEVSEPVYWSNGTLEYLNFPEASVIYGVGVHVLYLVVYDISGHETWHPFYITVIDTTDPSIVIPETNQTFELGPHGSVLTWTIYDLAQGTYEAYFNGSLDMTDDWVSNTGTELNVDGYMPGVYNVTVVLYDTSWNSVKHSINMTVIDTTAPSISVFPSDDTIEAGTMGNVLNWTVVELDPAYYNVTINSEFSEEIEYNNGTVILDIDGMILGFYNITVEFFDNSGNLVNDSVYITVTDTIAPMISAETDIVLEFGSVGNVANWTSTDVLPFNYTAYIDATNWTSGFWSNGSVVSIDIDGLSVGNHTLRIYFADTTSNTDYAEIVISVRDRTNPTWDQPPEDQVFEYGTSFYYDINATDLSVISYSINNSIYFEIDTASGVIANITNLLVGNYGLQINATDALGNVLTISITITVEDTTDPLWIQTPEQQILELGLPFFYDVNASDLSTLSYTIDDTTHFHIDSLNGEITNATFLDVGVYELQVTATDSEGNVLSTTFVITVDDTISPVIDTSPNDMEYTEGTTGHTVIWIVTDLDSGNYSLYIDDEYISTESWTSLVPIIIVVEGLSEGEHTIELRFFDNSGNMITSSITITVTPSLSTSITNTPSTPITDTATTPITPPEGAPMLLVVVGVGVSGIVLVALGIGAIKKRAT
ncbi:MAG: right-handed parallel beta-helix repeat-containing protein [Candidatus Thorarchaeota archaeon]